jgi:catechol 2,3-dioxygenase-like lactoylglutathione lyase family enzyme
MNTTGRISQIQVVMIPATDQDRSIAFYHSLGFEKRSDIQWGDRYRWVEVYPPGGTTGIALVPPRSEDATGVQTGIILNTDDIESSHAQLRAAGIDVDNQVARVGSPGEIQIGAVQLAGPVPPMFYLRDPDGNALLLVQPGQVEH